MAFSRRSIVGRTSFLKMLTLLGRLEVDTGIRSERSRRVGKEGGLLFEIVERAAKECGDDVMQVSNECLIFKG